MGGTGFDPRGSASERPELPDLAPLIHVETRPEEEPDGLAAAAAWAAVSLIAIIAVVAAFWCAFMKAEPTYWTLLGIVCVWFGLMTGLLAVALWPRRGARKVEP